MKKRVILTVLITLVTVGLIFGYKFNSIGKQMALMANQVQPPTTVSAVAAHEETWPNSLHAVATLASYRGVTLKAELAGTIGTVKAESGQLVAKGDELVVLDCSIEEAQLSGLRAQAKLAEVNLRRARELRSSAANTASDIDTAEAAYASSNSAVAQLEATIAKKHIVAPFSGRLGIVKVFPGQFLAAGDPLVQLECIDPIHVDFSLPQQELSRVAVGQSVTLGVDTNKERSFEGKVTAISPRVSETTRSIDVRATLANADEALRPGMFVSAELNLPATQHALVLPSTAVVHNPYGETIYVIENGIAKQRFIKTGAQRGDLIMVLSGLKAGEMVVTSGQIKLRNGSTVTIDNSVAPLSNPAPKPQES